MVRPEVDPTWRFMTIDHDGKIRMDPSSPYAMKGLVDQLNAGAWDKYDLVGGTTRTPTATASSARTGA